MTPSVPENIAWSSFAPDDWRAMARAAADVAECVRVLDKTGDNLVGELLRLEPNFYEWEHFPADDVYDAVTHAQYYYHAHAAEVRVPDEHGHFHTFMRGPGMAAAVPARVPDPESIPRELEGRTCHLVGISMDAAGRPFRLFTTNRWVTAEVWYRAPDVIAALDGFAVDQARPSWPVNRWISAMLRLFRPQIEALIRARDLAIGLHATGPSASPNPFEDREIEVLSELPIDVADQERRVARALAAL